MKEGIFISYSRKDKKWLELVKTNLSILEHSYNLEIWDDTKIRVGSEWNEEISLAISNCKIAILLVSSNFLASQFILKNELPQIFNVKVPNGLVIFNVIIDICTFELTVLNKYQCLNDPKQPLEELKSSDRKRVLVKLATELKTFLEENRIQNIENCNNAPNKIDNLDLNILLIIKYLSKNSIQSITDIEKALLINRKFIYSSLELLTKIGFVDKTKSLGNKKTSTFWEALDKGKLFVDNFESKYFKI